MAETAQSEKAQGPAAAGSLHVGGNVEKSVVIAGDHNVVHYYAANGEKRELRTVHHYSTT